MTTTPFPIDTVQTAISVGYRNRMYIADAVLPRVPVVLPNFKYQVFPETETFRAPDDRVGRRGKVNEVLLTATEVTSSTDDYGLEDPIPGSDIEQAAAAGMRSPVDHATMQLTDYILLNHERRVAALVFDAAQYPTGNKIQLTGNDQWNEHSQAESNPIADLMTGADAMLMKATHLAMGSAVWIQLRTHPSIVKAVHGNDGDVGIVTRRQVAELFELEEVLVGEAFLNTAAYGQAETLGRVWGNHALLFHHNPVADARTGLTFGYTAEWKTRVSGTISDANIGLRGGTRVRVGESVKELIVAPRAAYFVEDAI